MIPAFSAVKVYPMSCSGSMEGRVTFGIMSFIPITFVGSSLLDIVEVDQVFGLLS